MTAEASSPGGVGHAALHNAVAQTLQEAATARGEQWWLPLDVRYGMAEALDAAGLLAAPVPAADTDEALRQRLSRIFDLQNADDDPWRLDLMVTALSRHVTEAEERGRRAGLVEAQAVVAVYGFGPHELIRRLIAATTSDEEVLP